MISIDKIGVYPFQPRVELLKEVSVIARSVATRQSSLISHFWIASLRSQ
ncbi:hypothetical protein MNBD_ALPHA04-2079 [hydrothermal vent metagenome]|uniref:Uncharacterized protein n=1 Tax=hydrothermal vent metagenome TaxID=652676 RepID=A0A3B0S652_9ZZZZ